MSEFSRETLLNIIETDHVQCGDASALARMALAVMDSEPVAEVYQAPNVGICAALGPSIRMLCPLEPGTKLYRHAQPAPVVPEDFDFNRFNDVVWLECVASNPHMHSPTTSAIARVALELNKRSATMEAEPDRNPVLAYADSYRDMAKQGVDSVPIWNVITDLERNIAPLYRHAQPAQVVPDEKDKTVDADDHPLLWSFNEGWNACRAAMLQAGTLTNEGTKQAWTGIPDIDNAINMLDRIDTLESCDDDRIEAVKTVLRGLAGNSPVIPDGSADMLRRWLAFGRGMQNAGSQLPHNLIAETESMLAAAPQEDINALIPLVSRDEQEVK
ncbi:hypothetical protein [Klebsiella pneumoniae]|uniref:hypothetical protein n=1 Tax=Klebsiella pneumoniae TaxID=573 RepID=UPI003AB9D371